MASQVYFESGGVGDWYTCLSQASNGQSPASHPSKWERVELPQFLATLVGDLAVAYMQRGEGQSDKSLASFRAGQPMMDEFILRHADLGTSSTPMVFTR
jgi:hypothetical protein